MIRGEEASRRAALPIELKILPLLLLSLFGPPIGSTAAAAPASAAMEPARDAVIRPDAADLLRRDGHAVLWVYFTDKGQPDAASLQRAVADAGARVAAASRARRARSTEGRFTPDVTDVPVADRYLGAVESTGARIRHASRWLNAVSVEADARAAGAIAALPFVARVTRVLASVPQLDPPGAGNYGAALTQNSGVNAIAANDSGYTANGIVVAVFDTGFRKDHLALAPLKRIAEWDFVQSDGETANQGGEIPAQWGHGTGVWSILGGYLPGTLVGPAFNASFVLAKTKDTTILSSADEDRWVAAAQWADSIGVDIVQSSMVVQYAAGSLDGKTTPMAIATNVLKRHGVLVVTAMGNTGPGATTMWTPSDCDSILAVGSVTSANVISSFSSRGPTADGRGKPDVVAQGEGVVWADPSCTTCTGTTPGTSLAAPLVSGIAALAMEAHPEWTPQQVRYAIKSTADKASTRDSTTYGWGRPNAVTAIYGSPLGPPIYPKPFALTTPTKNLGQVAPPVTFRWRKSGDVNPGDAVSYAIQMTKVSTGAVIYSTTTPDTFATYSGALENGTIYDWNVVATDLGSHARPAREGFRFTSAGGLGAPPTVTAPASAGGPENALITFGITANDPDADPIWTLTGSPMPTGATLTPNGTNTSATFSWTPTYSQSGSYPITFTAANAFSGTASTTITVTNVNRAPTLAPISPITMAPTATATRSLIASDPDGDAVALSKLSGPAFASVAGTTLTVTPGSGDTGSYTIVVRATDGSLNADQSVSLTVTTAAPPGLVAAFGFNEGTGGTTADLSTNGYTGTLVNSPTWTTGKNGNALSFNATDDGIDSNDPRVWAGTALNVPNLPFTFSAWVNPVSYADYRAIFSKRDGVGSANMRLDIGLLAGTGQVYLDAGNNRTFAYAPPVNRWTHLTVVAQTSGTTLYVNGVQQETAGSITLGSKTTANVGIGGTGEPLSGDNDPFKGMIDDLRLYNRVLTLTEIQDDMNTGIGTGAQPPVLVITQPTNGATVTGTTVNVTYTTTGDLTGVNHVHFQLDSNPVVMDLSFDGVYQFTGVSAGSHTLNGFLVDSNHVKFNGSDATPVSFTTTVADTTPPTVSMTSPAPSSTLTGTVALQATASDNTGVLGVQFKIGTTNIVPEDTTSPYSVSLNTASFANGAYTLTAVARDAAGNTTTSAGVPVTISNVNPNDPAVVGQWSVPFIWPNVAVHMNLMPNGKILSWSDHTNGSDGASVLNTADNSFTVVPYNPANLFCAGQVNLADGRVLVNGGHIAAYQGITGTTFFNPSNNTWSAGPDMAYGRWYPTTIMLPDGRILTVSGAINCPNCAIPGGPDSGIATIPEIYNPTTNTWTQLPTAAKNFPIYPHLFVLPDGKILATATQEDPIPTSMLDLTTQAWTTVDPAVIDAGSTVMYLPGKFMKSGAAVNPDYSPLPANANTYVLDMTGGPSTWQARTPMAFPRTQHDLTLLPDGNVLVTGGSRNSNVFDEGSAVMEAEMWSPTTETYQTMSANTTPRMYHSNALLLPDGRVLSAGGGRYGPDHLSGEYYSPPYLFKGARPTITSAPSTVDHGANITVVTPDAARIAKVSLIKYGSVTHSINSEQRFLPLAFTRNSGNLTVTMPLTRNLAPPGYYMLFLVDSTGVPSTAATLFFPVPSADVSPPTQPGSLAATGAPGKATLSWTASTDNIGVVAYDVYRSTTPGFTPAAGNRIASPVSPGYADLGLPAGTYYYRVIARDDAGNPSPASNEASAVVTADVSAPTVPLNLAAVAISATRIDVTWSASSDNVRVAGYHVRRNGTVIGTSTTTDFSDTGVGPSMTCTYSVDSYDDAGNTSPPAPPVSATTPSSPSLSASLVAGWAMNEGAGGTTADFSGHGYTGTLTLSPTWTTGKYGNGLFFNATDDGIDSNDPRVTIGTTFDVPNPPFTFCAWVNPASYVDYRAIFSKRDVSGAAGMRLDVGLSGISGRVYLSGGSGPFTFLYAPTVNVWTHLAIVVQASGTFLYVNGTLQETLGAITLGTKTTANAVIGGTGEPIVGGDNDPFKGKLDEIRFYNRVLTVAEIQSVMNTGADAVPPNNVSITSPSASSTLSGTVTITATAADDIGVAGVQFRVGNVDLLPEDTTSPYSIALNTTAFPNGPTTLLAIARDAAGNATTSSSVPVTIANVLTGVDEDAMAPAAPVLRVFPNPFAGSAAIVTRGFDRVAVFDVTGRLVRTWKYPSARGGLRRLDWDGSDGRGTRLPGGIYFVKAGRLVTRVVLLR